jgi:hypothetical protein
MLSKVISVLSLVVTILTAGATWFEAVSPKYAIWAAIAAATISAFTRAVTEKIPPTTPSA